MQLTEIRELYLKAKRAPVVMHCPTGWDINDTLRIFFAHRPGIDLTDSVITFTNVNHGEENGEVTFEIGKERDVMVHLIGFSDYSLISHLSPMTSRFRKIRYNKRTRR